MNALSKMASHTHTHTHTHTPVDDCMCANTGVYIWLKLQSDRVGGGGGGGRAGARERKSNIQEEHDIALAVYLVMRKSKFYYPVCYLVSWPIHSVGNAFIFQIFDDCSRFGGRRHLVYLSLGFNSLKLSRKRYLISRWLTGGRDTVPVQCFP